MTSNRLNYNYQVMDAINNSDRITAKKLIREWADADGFDTLINSFIETSISISQIKKNAVFEHSILISAIEQSTDVIVITDKIGNIQYANPAFVTSTGYSLEEIIGLNPRVLKSGMQDATFYQGLWETINSGRSWSGRFVNRRKDGSFYIEDATITPVRAANGEIESYVAVKRDISEHLKLHEEREVLEAKLVQSQKMDAIGRLAGGIAHDFNNMLNVILGYTELSLDELIGESRLKSYLEQIQDAGRRSAELTRQLLAFSRKQTAAPVVVDINRLIEENLKMLSRMIGEEIAVSFTPDRKLWKVRIDRSQFDQILANLAVNSRDAINGSGYIQIETTNYTYDAEEVMGLDMLPGEYVALSFTDSGCGMTPQVADHIFEPFFTTKDGGKGTGLGLATVYGIVKQNEGSIQVESTPEKGASFTIYIPAIHETVEPVEMEPAKKNVGRNSETVLVVEDEVQILEFTKIVLEDAGYNVIAAESPEKALKACNGYNKEIHILVTDVVMPGMNGKELQLEISQMRPDIRVLFMSGYTSDIIACKGILEEGTDFIHKPFQVKSFLEKVRSVLDE